MAGQRLSLLAQDSDDLIAISALLQDMIVRPADVAFLPARRQFAMLGSRCCRERAGPARRVRSLLTFAGVMQVQSRRWPGRDAPTPFLSLLALDLTHAQETTDAAVVLTFAGDIALRLEIECVDAWLRDVSAPWPAQAVPRHDDEPGQ